MRLFYLGLAVILGACQTQSTVSLQDLKSAPTSHEWIDLILSDRIDPTQIESLKQECVNSSERVCLLVQNYTSLSSYVKRNKEPKFYPPQSPQEFTRVTFFSEGVLQPLKTIKTVPAPDLVKNLKELTEPQIKKLIKASERQTCPNRLSAALAATLETGTNRNLDQIGNLYSQSARCRQLSDMDRDNYYARPAFLWLVQNNPNRAYPFLIKASRLKNPSARTLYWTYTLQKQLKKKVDKQLVDKLIQKYPLSLHRLILSPPQLAEHTFISNADQKDLKLASLLQLSDELIGRGQNEESQILSDWMLERYAKSLTRENKFFLMERASFVTQIQQINPWLSHSRLSPSFLKLSFPKGYSSLIESAFSFDPFLGFAIARQESKFYKWSLSRANAVGIFQILPETAEKIRGGGSKDLFDLKNNADIAAHYVQELNDEWKGNLPKIIASYNAGEHKVRDWSEASSLLLWIDAIPYRETRDYVAQVLSHYYWYHRLYSGKEIDFSSYVH